MKEQELKIRIHPYRIPDEPIKERIRLFFIMQWYNLREAIMKPLHRPPIPPNRIWFGRCRFSLKFRAGEYGGGTEHGTSYKWLGIQINVGRTYDS